MPAARRSAIAAGDRSSQRNAPPAVPEQAARQRTAVDVVDDPDAQRRGPTCDIALRKSRFVFALVSLSSSSSIDSTDRQRVEHLAQDPDAAQLVLRHQQLFLARARLVDVDRRENALVDQLAVEVDLAVAGALELLEDHVVHAAAGVDERGRDDGQRAALLDVARRAEEPLRAVQGVGVDAAREDLARRRLRPCCRRAPGG